MRNGTVLGSTTRRSFIKGAATAVAAGALAGCASQEESAEEPVVDAPETTHKLGFCRGQCLCWCIYDVHVRDGQIVRMTAADLPNPNYNGVCTKGQTQLCHIYNADRLQYPMKRAGEGHEIADGILYLSSDFSTYTTGNNMVIDGGWQCGFTRDW